MAWHGKFVTWLCVTIPDGRMTLKSPVTVFILLFLPFLCSGKYLRHDQRSPENTKSQGSAVVSSDNQKLGNVSEIRYYLFTKDNPDVFDEIRFGELDSINGSHFLEGMPLKFIVHGFGGHWDEGGVMNIKDAYVHHPENSYNVILMDWATMSTPPDYFTAFINAQLASDHTALLLKLLVDSGKLGWGDIHLIGHSLGGQTVGIIGNRVQGLGVGGMIGRITALDPALPLFDVTTPENRTTADDASFVDVIHTACNGWLAFWEASGHVDWYPNGGRFQAGCGLDFDGGCSHNRAYEYFHESILALDTNQNGFWGKQCSSYEEIESGNCSGEAQVMGEYTPLGTRGMHFLETNSKSPFAKGIFT